MDSEKIKALQYCACFRLRAAARKTSRMYEDALRPIGLRVTQFTLLSIIFGTKPNSITGLADDVCMDRTALNRALGIMVKNGWITVAASDDSLEKKIRITEEGARKLESAVPLWERAQSQFIRKSGPENWEGNRNWLIDVASGSYYQAGDLGDARPATDGAMKQVMDGAMS